MMIMMILIVNNNDNSNNDDSRLIKEDLSDAVATCVDAAQSSESKRISLSLSIYLYISLSLYLSLSLYIYIHTHTYIHICTCLSIYLSIYLPIHPFKDVTSLRALPPEVRARRQHRGVPPERRRLRKALPPGAGGAEALRGDDCSIV